MTIKKENLISKEISEALNNKRLDLVLAETFPEYSRSRLKKWLQNNLVSVNKEVINKPSHKIIFPAKLELSVPNENLILGFRFRLVHCQILLCIKHRQCLLFQKQFALLVKLKALVLNLF